MVPTNEEYSPYSGGKPANYSVQDEFLEDLDVIFVHSRRRRKEPGGY